MLIKLKLFWQVLPLMILSNTFRSRVPAPSSACSTCYCQICGEDSATATCYSCTSMYSDGGCSDYKQLERKSSIKSISKIGDRTLAIIETDSDSSLGSFGSIDSPKTAWRKNVSTATEKGPQKKSTTDNMKSTLIANVAGRNVGKNSIEDDDDEEETDTNSITDSSVASVIEAVNRATDGHDESRGEVIEGYFRNPTSTASAANAGTAANGHGAIYGFTLRRKMAGSPAMNSRPRPSFRQYNATVTSRQSRISVDSLASPLSSLTLIGQNKVSSSSSNSNNIDSAVTTLSRNRGPRPAYSDANMPYQISE